MKICSDCKKNKRLDRFYKSSTFNDGLSYVCKSCSDQKCLRYTQTKGGLIASIYSHQKSNSSVRGRSIPSYSLDELKSWFSDQPMFNRIFNTWVKSGYSTPLRPSVDRINPRKGYSIGNIQLITWRENRAKGYKERVTGAAHKCNIPVLQFTITGVFIRQYYSQKNASDVTGVNYSRISVCCREKEDRKSVSGGFIWRLAS